MNANSIGETLGAIWKVSIIICLVLMIVDAVMRFTGRRLGVFHSVRFIWFIYGTACAWAVGGLAGLTTPYRFFNDGIFSKFLEEIYFAYWGSKEVKFFKNRITISGAAQDDRNLAVNAIFFETIIFIILRILNLVTAKLLVSGDRLANLYGTLRRVVGIFLALYSSRYGLSWYQYIHTLSKLPNVEGRAHINVLLSWAVSLYVHIECLWAITEVVLHILKEGKVDKNLNPHKKPYIANTPSTPHSAHNMNTSMNNMTISTARSTHKHKPMISNHLSYDSFMDEVSYMFQDKKTAI